MFIVQCRDLGATAESVEHSLFDILSITVSISLMRVPDFNKNIYTICVFTSLASCYLEYENLFK